MNVLRSHTIADAKAGRNGGWALCRSAARKNRFHTAVLQNAVYFLGFSREPKKVDGILQHGSVEAVFSRGRPTERPTTVSARFRIGDRVRAKNIHPTMHTRLPRYVRGRTGIIELLHGCHVFP